MENIENNLKERIVNIPKKNNISDKDFEHYLLNLKILSKIEKNDKLSIDDDNGLMIEKPYYFQWASRYYYNNSRYRTIQYINKFYCNLYKLVQFKFNKDFMNLNKNTYDDGLYIFYINERDELASLKKEIQNSIYGLNKLISTYSTDQKMYTALNKIISNANDIIKYIKDNLETVKIKYMNIKNERL